jgi:hypothetical protein
MPSCLAGCIKYSAPPDAANFIGASGVFVATHPHTRTPLYGAANLHCALHCVRGLKVRLHDWNSNKLGIISVFRFLCNVFRNLLRPDKYYGEL